MATTDARPLRAGGDIKELTIRGIILGAVLTFILTAANVYAGLKIGLTVATSIPAAVISMAVLRSFRDSTIQENNIVQTIASAAGTLSAIVFVLPGLIMVGWWTGFPYWLSVAVIAIGGILGVMYSVPLRRALIVDQGLAFPEGKAAAEVLKTGENPAAGVKILGLAALGGGFDRCRAGHLLACTHLGPARVEPRDEQRSERRGEQHRRNQRAGRPLALHRASLHAYPAPLTETISTGLPGSSSSFFRSTAIAMSTARVCRSPRCPNTCSSSSARVTTRS